jgi:hypothetical protein
MERISAVRFAKMTPSAEGTRVTTFADPRVCAPVGVAVVAATALLTFFPRIGLSTLQIIKLVFAKA